MLGIVLDVLTVLFFIYLFKKCAAKSKLQNAVESLGYVISAVLSVPVAVFLGDLSYSRFFRPVIVERVDMLVKTSGDVDASVDDVERIMSGMPSIVNNGARLYHTTTGKSLEEINRLLAGDLSTITGPIVDIIARPVVDGVLRALFFGVAFAACYYFFKALYPTIEAYFYNPDRAAVSPTIGMVLGAGKVLTVFLIVVSMLSLVGAILPDIYLFRPSTYHYSFLFKLFFEDNLLLMFLGDGLV